MNQYLEIAESMAYSCCCSCLVTKSCSSLCDPLPVAHQAPLSMGFPRQESWSGVPFPSPEDLPDPGIKPVSPTLQVVTCIASEFFPSWAFGEAPLKESDQIKSDQSLSRVRLFATPWITFATPVHHQPPEFTQTQVHQVSDAIQPSHPLSPPSPPVPKPSQHQSLFQWVNSSHKVAKVLEFQL